MQVKVKIHKRVLLSFEMEVQVEQNFDKEALVCAVHQYAPEEFDGWNQEGAAEYDSDKTGVPRDSVTHVERIMPYFDGLAGRIIEKP